jgi:hypothetical protein
MNKIPDNLISSKAPDECHQVLNALLLRWPVEPNEELPSALLDHLCHCRSCLRKWIALEAAADLATFPVNILQKSTTTVCPKHVARKPPEEEFGGRHAVTPHIRHAAIDLKDTFSELIVLSSFVRWIKRCHLSEQSVLSDFSTAVLNDPLDRCSRCPPFRSTSRLGLLRDTETT